MLPISLVENLGFKDYINYLDPSFTMPSRRTIKTKGLPNLKEIIQREIKNELSDIPYVNVSTNLWTDATVRPFSGYIGQGINNKWELKTISIEFDYITGQ